jgi:FAR-17a/AIG1-like protein
VVQVIFLTIAVLFDFTGSPDLKKKRDYIFGTLSFPLALETTFMYWSMRLIDRELVFPKALDEFFPVWLDIALHTNVTIFVLLEMFFVKHQYPERKLAIKGLTTFMIGYLIWLLIIKANTGRWVYQLFEALPYPQRIVFFILSGVFSTGLYFIGEVLNKCCSGSETSSKKKTN